MLAAVGYGVGNMTTVRAERETTTLASCLAVPWLPRPIRIAGHSRNKPVVPLLRDSVDSKGKDFPCDLAKEEEIAQIITRFPAEAPTGTAVQELEGLVRAALFKPATSIVGNLLQGAADKIDRQYQAKPGEEHKGRETIQVQCLFGTFPLERDYYWASNRVITQPMPVWAWKELTGQDWLV